MSNLSVSVNLTLRQIYEPILTAWFSVDFIIFIPAVIVLVLLIYVIPKGQHKLSSSTIQIIHLLVSELVICGIMYPTLCFMFFLPNFKLGYLSCDFFQFFYMLMVGVEQWSTFSLAINRFIGIFMPHFYQRFASLKYTVLIILSTWVLPLTMNLLILFQVGGKSTANTKPWNSCIVQPSKSGDWALKAVNYVCTIIPLAGTMMAYLAIMIGSWLVGFRRSNVEGGALPAQAKGAAKRKVNRLNKARMLFVSVLWYLVCYLPHTLIVSSFPYLYGRDPPLGLWMRTIYIMGFAGSPFIFLIMSQEYRRKLFSLFSKSITKIGISGSHQAGSASGYSTKHQRNTGGKSFELAHPQAI